MPTLYTNQELISKAIDLQLDVEGYSCRTFITLYLCYYIDYMNDLKYQYADYTEAHPDGGFNHLLKAGVWKNMSFEEKQSYRLEMLYYFWLANQDSMDAFS